MDVVIRAGARCASRPCVILSGVNVPVARCAVERVKTCNELHVFASKMQQHFGISHEILLSCVAVSYFYGNIAQKSYCDSLRDPFVTSFLGFARLLRCTSQNFDSTPFRSG